MVASLQRDENMKPEKIENLKGVLCRDIWGKVFIRAKGQDGTERDYRVDHCDLSIEVQDDDAYAYEKGGEWVIDYGPDTLGSSAETEDADSDGKSN